MCKPRYTSHLVCYHFGIELVSVDRFCLHGDSPVSSGLSSCDLRLSSFVWLLIKFRSGNKEGIWQMLPSPSTTPSLCTCSCFLFLFHRSLGCDWHQLTNSCRYRGGRQTDGMSRIGECSPNLVCPAVDQIGDRSRFLFFLKFSPIWENCSAQK